MADIKITQLPEVAGVDVGIFGKLEIVRDPSGSPVSQSISVYELFVAMGAASYGGDLIALEDDSSARSYLGLGTLATQNGTFSGTSSGTNTGDQTTITGNAGTATALQTARTINGTSFNGTANITITAAAGTLTGTTLAAGVASSSLTSFGSSPTLVTPTFTTSHSSPIWGAAAGLTLRPSGVASTTGQITVATSGDFSITSTTGASSGGAGSLTTAGGIYAAATILSATNLQAGATSNIMWNNRARLSSPSTTTVSALQSDGTTPAIFNAGSLVLSKTITPTGTTGAQTINSACGSVNLAAAATSLVVTNSLVSTSSVIQVTVGSNDLNTKSCTAVAASGSFTVRPNTAPAAETIIYFNIIN